MASSRALYTLEEVLGMMDDDGEEIEFDIDEASVTGTPEHLSN